MNFAQQAGNGSPRHGKGQWMMKRKKTDERVVAEINRIYKVGYLILSFGIGADVLLQIIYSNRVNALELFVLLLTQVVCLILQVHKGLADDNQYAEADTFPLRHNLKIGVLVGFIPGLLLVAMRLMQPEVQAFGAQSMALIAGIMLVSIVVVAEIFYVGLQYVVFRLAKRRRKHMYDDQEDD